jgi:beta-glucosidase
MSVQRPLKTIGPHLAILAIACVAEAQTVPHREDAARIESILKRLTLEEKLGQLQQLGGDPNTGRPQPGQIDLIRKGAVGSLLNVRGAANVNSTQRVAVEQSTSKIPLLFAFDVIHGYRTVFPIPLAEASSWDPGGVERAARIAALEASAAGVRWVFAPMLDIARDPRWGRISEGFGEDPFLASVMARAKVRGYQGDDLAAPDRVVACAKHWVAYGAAEAGRDYNTVDLSERTLRTIYFPPFRAAIDAGVGTVMTSFNTINGIPAAANPFTLGKVLRGDWQFDGVVVTDYEAVPQLIPHGVAADESEAARLALLAGNDMEMQSRLFSARIPQLIDDGRVSTARIDESVRRVLRLKLKLGLFDHPYSDESRERVIFIPEHQAAAREIAGRCLVLLKNDGGLLPLGKDIRSIAVLGPLADDKESPLEHWRGDGKTKDVVTLLAGIRAKVAGRGEAIRVDHAAGCSVMGDDGSGIAEAVRLARQADVAIVAVGETAVTSGEAASRSSLDLSGRQMDLVRAIHETGKPTVVVLINSRPLTIGWIAEHVPAIVEAWFGGTLGGHAIADALFGDINPGGKLPVTFPRVVGQVPIYYNHLNTGRPASPKDRYTSKYVDAPVTPLFAFGHGLSYTRFRLSDLQLSSKTIPTDGSLNVSVVVENVGDRAGDEVVQLYIRDVAASVARPVKELRGFERVTLRPGEKRTIPFKLTPESLAFYDRQMKFIVEPGEFRVFVGTSSESGIEASFRVVD